MNLMIFMKLDKTDMLLKVTLYPTHMIPE